MLEDRFIPDEVNEENRPVIQYIQRVSDTKIEDRESLARIRERLLHISAGPLPVPQDISNDEKSLEIIKIAPNPQREGNMRFLQPSYYRQKSWPQRLSMLAAVLFMILLVGSLAVILTRHGPVNPGTAGQSDISIHQGWTQMAAWSGTGNLKLSKKSIQLPRLWGYAVTCSGSGTIKINMKASDYGWDWDIGPCMDRKHIAPQQFSFDIVAHTLLSIEVTAPASMAWQLALVESAKQPTFTLGPQWAVSIGGSGNQSSGHSMRGEYQLGAVAKPNGQAIRPKSWGVIFTCLGEGNAQAEFTPTPDISRLDFQTCDGQPHFGIVHYSASATANNVDVIVSGGVLWSLQVVGCVDEQKCSTA